MESWDLVIVGSGPAALRSAIAAADAGTTPLILNSAEIGGGQNGIDLAGLAASIDEIDSGAHRDDTVAAGGELTDKVAAARVCGEAVETVSELERWGLVFRRREGGLPHTSQVSGHSMPRLTGCGDSTGRNITRILEEQAMKRRIVRRSNICPLSLVMDQSQVRGLTAIDLHSGEILGIQTKAIILATNGYQGIWSSPINGAGEGAALASFAGIKLEGMVNLPSHPLTMRGTDTYLSFDLLGSGGRVRRVSGEDIAPEEVGADDSILDLRGIDKSSAVWFNQTRIRVKNRMGLDISNEVVPITLGVAATTGGVPVDEYGRVTIDGGKKWATGLYAAGRSAHTGMHGKGILPGNIMLENLVTGKAAGLHAGAWSKDKTFSGLQLIEKEIEKSQSRIESLYSDNGNSVGQTAASLKSVMSSCINGKRNESSLQSASKYISNLKSTQIKITDKSRVMNTEMATALQLQGMIQLASQIVQS
tara:strand:+ start:9947 stop:11377 length:1431 start_codon:yes stop_codon:yes gene_type:complete